jgi:hypothetical protein
MLGFKLFNEKVYCNFVKKNNYTEKTCVNIFDETLIYD